MDEELQCKPSPSRINYKGTSVASKFLCANGITILKLREEIINLLGKSDMYCFSPEHPPLTELDQRTSNWALDEKIKLDLVAIISSILELGEPMNKVLESQNVVEDLEQLQASHICSQVPESLDGKSSASSTLKVIRSLKQIYEFIKSSNFSSQRNKERGRSERNAYSELILLLRRQLILQKGMPPLVMKEIRLSACLWMNLKRYQR